MVQAVNQIRGQTVDKSPNSSDQVQDSRPVLCEDCGQYTIGSRLHGCQAKNQSKEQDQEMHSVRFYLIFPPILIFEADFSNFQISRAF